MKKHTILARRQHASRLGGVEIGHIYRWLLAAAIVGVPATVAAQRWPMPTRPMPTRMTPPPQVAKPELPQVRAFLDRFDAAQFHYPSEVSTNGQVQIVHQPSASDCTSDPELDAMASYRNNYSLPESDRKKLDMLHFASRKCRPPFGAASNPFGRVPQGPKLSSLRSILGKKVAVVDYRLATPDQRAACTQAISRPLPKLFADATYMNAYRDQVHMVYDVGTDGIVHNISGIEAYAGEPPKMTRGLSGAAWTAARQTQYRPPNFQGLPLHCINVTEQFSKVGDRDGNFQSYREFAPVFGKRER